MKSLVWIEQSIATRTALKEILGQYQSVFEGVVNFIFVDSLAEAEALIQSSTVSYLILEPMILKQASVEFLKSLDALDLMFYTHLNASEFLSLAKLYKAHHILLKEIPFNPERLINQLRRILFAESYGRVWGFEEASQELHTVQNSDDMFNVMSRIEGVLENVLSIEARMEICTPLMEAITNAVYHAPKASSRSDVDKYRKGEHIEALESHEAVKISINITDDWVGIGIKDFQGTLTAERVLESICKNFTEESLYDENGRGFFLMYCLMDELQITIEPHGSCEIMLLKSRRKLKDSCSELDKIFTVEDNVSIKNKPFILNVVNPEPALA
jgi:anti-sigma regulatory factor (Ser/Thr protein kinase)